MIGRLKGIIDAIGENYLLIDVNGVGYMVEISTRLLASLPAQGSEVTLSIEPYIREDQFRLFGFANEMERNWFRLLLSVQGVGAKMALAIQGVLSVDELTHAITMQDKDMLARTSGVGAKLAGRIVQELKDKMPQIILATSTTDTSVVGTSAADTNAADTSVTDAGGAPASQAHDMLAQNAAQNGAMADALSALGNLGYTRPQAQRAVLAAVKQADKKAQAQDIIRLALQELGK
ncbi:MAG: Holliday junction branch migration protein RuvA [Alphaproteobacteria bacterium]|nr:Holliday junction branch migration protein RuvA [Alphaproteobacteria bacterium]